MPTPSPEHAQIMRKMSAEFRKAFPTAEVFSWHVIPNLDYGQDHVYISLMVDKNGERLEEGMPNATENLIVRRYEQELGWVHREEGIGFGYSVTEAKEIMDLEGTGTLDPEFEGHPGLEIWWSR